MNAAADPFKLKRLRSNHELCAILSSLHSAERLNSLVACLRSNAVQDPTSVVPTRIPYKAESNSQEHS
jgi:hypothetical protein